MTMWTTGTRLVWAGMMAAALWGCGDDTSKPKPQPDMSEEMGGDMSGDISSDMSQDMAPDMEDMFQDMVDMAPEVVIDPAGGQFSDRFALPGFLGQSAARVTALVEDDDGRLVAGGFFTHVGPKPARNIAVREQDGSWSELAGGLPYYVVGLVRLADGRLVAGGWSEDNGELDGHLSVLEGGQWRALGDLDGRVFHVSLTPTGEVMVGGNFSKIDQVEARALALWDGQAFTAAAPGAFGADAVVNNVTVREGMLCAVGLFGEVSGMEAGGVACDFPATGWRPLGALPGEVFDMASLEDGTLLAAGSFAMPVPGGQPGEFVAGLAKWSGDQWVAFEGRGIDGGLINQARDIEPLSGGAFLLAGQFSRVGGYLDESGPNVIQASHVARWTGSAWQALGTGVQPTIGPYAVNVEGGYKLLPTANGKVWMGGLFHRMGATLGTGLASWDGAVWTPAVQDATLQGIEGESRAVAVRADGSVYVAGALGATPDAPSLVVYKDGAFAPVADAPRGPIRWLWVDGQDRLVAAGRFSVAGKEAGLARFDGQAWEALVELSGEDGLLRVVPEVMASGEEAMLIVGGFDLGQGRRGVARVRADGAIEALGEGVPGVVRYIAQDEQGRPVVAGELGEDGLLRGPLVFDGTKWGALGGGLDGFVYGLVQFKGRLIVAGSYLKSAAPSAEPGEWAMAQWDGQAWSAFGGLAQEGFPAAAYFAQVFGGALYVGGGFTSAGGVPTRNLAYTMDGQTWAEVGGGLDDLTLAVGGDADALWFCGPYREAGGKPSYGIARLVLP